MDKIECIPKKKRRILCYQLLLIPTLEDGQETQVEKSQSMYFHHDKDQFPPSKGPPEEKRITSPSEKAV